MGIEAFVTDLIEGKKRSFPLERILYFFSLLYKSASYLRNFFYDTHLVTAYQSSLPVISVGNLVAGGTGKTPFVQKLVTELSKEPGSVAIVTRGYRSKAESQNIMASSGEGPLVLASLCGDEPYLLAAHTNASVWVGKDRVSSLQKILKTNARAIVLDDGFQHRKIKKDVEIVLLSSEDPFGKGYFLPRGYLRESPYSLKRADWIVITHLQSNDPPEALLQKIRKFSKAPITGFSSHFELKSTLKGKKVGAFCGIAKPDSFYRALSEVEVVKTLTLPDHRSPSSLDLLQFATECQRLGAESLICTEKDQVKLLDISSLPLPVETLKMQLTCTWNENVWKEIVQSIQTMM